MGYTAKNGVLRKRFESGRTGVNPVETHAFLITDIEFFVLKAWLQAARAGLSGLADRVLRVGLDWEHHQALLANDPDARSSEDNAEQERLAEATEVLAADIDVRTGVVDRAGVEFPPYREPSSSDK